MKILRWILFLPLSWLSAGFLAYINHLMFYRYSWIEYFWHPIISNIAFFYTARYIIPSTTKLKNRLPLILIIMGNTIGLLAYFFYFYLIYTDKAEFEIKYLFSFIGILVTLYNSIHIIRAPEKLKKLEDNTNKS